MAKVGLNINTAQVTMQMNTFKLFNPIVKNSNSDLLYELEKVIKIKENRSEISI